MALAKPRLDGNDRLNAGFGSRLSRRWERAVPALLLAAAFVVSLIGIYALGRSAESWVGRPGEQISSPGAAQDAGTLARSLTRLGWSQPDVPADVLLVSPDYFHAVGWTPKSDMNPLDHVILMVAENIHDGDLPAFQLPQLWINEEAMEDLAWTKVMADSPHHRTTAVIFDRPQALSTAIPGATIGLAFPTSSTPGALTWDASALAASEAGTIGFHLTGATILALLAGLLVSMWPCLFQLTAYFIPSLAGISMSDAHGGVSTAARWRVVKMATFFVAGFVIVYTLAGAAAGFAAQSFDTQSLFETWRRPLTIVAGCVMLVLALRQAARARLPLVCKMPLLARFGKSRGGQPGYGSAMLMGLAYATGCATCFGAAVLLGMLVYVGVAGAPFTGAAVMFLFSVGMGIPLVIGASLMAQVLPLLERFTSASRYLALASSAMMLAMAVLLLSDHFMGFSNGVAQLVGGGSGTTG